MDHVFDFQEARDYARWLDAPETKAGLMFEHRLMVELLGPSKGEFVLDIGCGTGNSMTPFLDLDLAVTGIDASPYMLDIALAKFGNRTDLYRGNAADLPFEDNSFNYACLNVTLEFVDNPEHVIREACRVAKDKLFIGALNRYAIKGIQRRIKGVFVPSIFNHARFFSVWEIKRMLESILGDVPIKWRSVCHLPKPSSRFVNRIEENSIVQRCPTGEFVGIAATLMPRFRTRPLAIKHSLKHSTGMAAG